MVRHEIECRRTTLECRGFFSLLLELENHVLWSSCKDGLTPRSPRISAHSALPALLGTLVCCKMLQILSSRPRMEGIKNLDLGDFPGGSVVRNLPANAGDMGSIAGPGRSHMPRSN